MTDDRLNNIARAMAFTVIMFILLLAFIAKAFGQDHDHVSDSFARFDRMRLYPPAKVLYIEPVEKGLKIDLLIQTKLEMRYVTVTTNESTGKDSKITKGKLYWVLVCADDGYLYAITEVLPSQVKR